MATEKQVQDSKAVDDDFSLNTEQMVFMFNADNALRKAEAEGDTQFFRDLAASPEYKALFGEMSIDQAIDRYELMIGEEI
jgi:hypothetical protein